MSPLTFRFAMRRSRVGFTLLVSAVIAAAFSYASHTRLSAASGPAPRDEQALKSFAALHPIDVHVHVFKTDPAFQAMLEQLNLKLLNILVVDDTLPYRKQLQPQIDDALALVRSSHGHVALCTTFDPYQISN